MTAPKELMSAFNYTEADLETNRRGSISEAQRERLAQIGGSIRSASGRGIWVIYGFVGLGICLWSAVYLYNSPNDFVKTIWNPSNLAAIAFAGLLLVAIVGYSVWQARRNSAGLTDPRLPLLRAEGRASVRKVSYYSRGVPRSYFAVTVGNKTFKWMEDIASFFLDGTSYCIYYCRSGPYEQVLSIDRLDS